MIERRIAALAAADVDARPRLVRHDARPVAVDGEARVDRPIGRPHHVVRLRSDEAALVAVRARPRHLGLQLLAVLRVVGAVVALDAPVRVPVVVASAGRPGDVRGLDRGPLDGRDERVIADLQAAAGDRREGERRRRDGAERVRDERARARRAEELTGGGAGREGGLGAWLEHGRPFVGGRLAVRAWLDKPIDRPARRLRATCVRAVSIGVRGSGGLRRLGGRRW